MQEPNEQPSSSSQFGLQETVNITYVLTSCLSTCVTVFTRWKFGSQALGFNAVAAFLILLLTASFTNDDSLALMCLAWCGMLVVQRFRTLRDWRKGIRRHSQYGGEPGMAMLLLKDEAQAKWLEPFLCAAIAVLLSPVSLVLSKFVLAAAAALLIRTWIESEIVRAQLRQLHDAEIAQQGLIDRWQRERGEF